MTPELEELHKDAVAATAAVATAYNSAWATYYDYAAAWAARYDDVTGTPAAKVAITAALTVEANAWAAYEQARDKESKTLGEWL